MVLDEQKITREHTIRLWRFVLVFLTDFFITWYLQMPQAEWALVISSIVLFDTSTVGNVCCKSYLRFLGTILSAILAFIVIYMTDNNSVMNLLTVTIWIFIYGYLFMDTKKSALALLGGTTLTLLFFNYNHIDYVLVRPVVIIIGIVVPVFMLRFFYPQYAREKLMCVLADSMSDLIDMLTSLERKDLIAHRIDFQENIEAATMETKRTPDFVLKSTLAMNAINQLDQLVTVFIYHTKEYNSSANFLAANPWLSQNIQEIIQYLNYLKNQINASSCLSIEKKALPILFLPEISQENLLMQHVFEDIQQALFNLFDSLQVLAKIRLNQYREK